MDLSKARAGFSRRYPQKLTTLETHGAGEGARLIIDGIGPLPGRTMAEKLTYFQENLDHIRLMLTREPRGCQGILAAAVTEPCSPGAAFGLIYMDARRYPFLCGHATMCAVTAMIEIGALDVQGPEPIVVVDTPSGPMETKALIKGGRVESVAIRTVPSFVYGSRETLKLHGRDLSVDTVCVGGFFVMADAAKFRPEPLDLSPENAPNLINLGMTMIEEANRQLTVRHPTRPEVRTVDVVEFYREGPGPRQGGGVVIYGESHMDRSPCGTGTAAKLTLMHHEGRIGKGESYLNHSPLGTFFEAAVVSETMVGDIPAVVVEIRGSAYVTGWCEFVVDPADPFPRGFML
ncbi:MAG: proline racemase family protein [Pseudomonadota bacterium]